MMLVAFSSINAVFVVFQLLGNSGGIFSSPGALPDFIFLIARSSSLLDNSVMLFSVDPNPNPVTFE